MTKTKFIAVAAAVLLTTMATACGDQKANTDTSSSAVTTSSVSELENTEATPKDITAIDPFDGLNVVFNGDNGSGTVEMEYTGNNAFIRDNVRFHCDSPNSTKLSNGDVISVSARCTPKDLQENNLELSSTEKEYTVTELGGFVEVPDGYDFSEIDAIMEDGFLRGKWENMCGIGKIINDVSESDAIEWQINDRSYTLYEKKLYLKNNNPVPNYYYIFYKLDFECEKIDGVYVDNPDSEYDYGDIVHWKGLAVVQLASLYADNHSMIVKSNFENDINSLDSQIIYFCKDETALEDKINEEMSNYQKRFDAVYDVK